jgi:hypothetical protein
LAGVILIGAAVANRSKIQAALSGNGSKPLSADKRDSQFDDDNEDDM